MKTDTANGYFNNLLIPGTILLANIDVSGLLVYGIKAAIGGAIWLGFKVAGDWLEQRRDNPSARKPAIRKRNRFFSRKEKNNQ
jgi:hypothetical protein